MSDKHHVATYPREEQYQVWKEDADEMDLPMSQYAKQMIEAGRKDFPIDITPDETNSELREQRNDLKQELEHTRERIEELETQLYGNKNNGRADP